MSGYKVFQNGDILDANTDVNPFLMRQTVMVFEDAADRTAQLDGDELEGMVTYLKDVAHLQRYDGSDWVAAAGLVEIVTFTADGDFEKGDYPWLRAVRVRMVGSGGGGAGSDAGTATEASVGGGGGAGGYAERFIDDVASLDASIPVTVPNGGAGGVASSGTSGSSSLFGTDTDAWFTQAGFGGFGTKAAASTVLRAARGGAPGVGVAGDILTSGQAGSFGVSLTPGAGAFESAHGGAGGSSVLGGGGRGQWIAASPTDGGFGGGGGGGASSGTGGGQAAKTGGAGGPGIVILELYA